MTVPGPSLPNLLQELRSNMDRLFQAIQLQSQPVAPPSSLHAATSSPVAIPQFAPLPLKSSPISHPLPPVHREPPLVRTSPLYDRSYVDMVKSSILSQPRVPPSSSTYHRVVQKGIASSNPNTTICNPSMNPQVSFPSSRAFTKLQELRSLSQKGITICYRCGDCGHLASSCRNSLVYFECGRVGHRSAVCKTRHQPSISHTNPSQMEIANRLPPLRLSSNRDNILFQKTLAKGVVFRNLQNKGAFYIQSHLTNLFRRENWQWLARKLSNSCYLVEPPDDQWQAKALSIGHIWLVEIFFPIEPYNEDLFDGGTDPVPVWVLMRGLPSKLWRDRDFRKTASELGGSFIDIYPRSGGHLDMTELQICFGVAVPETILEHRRLEFTMPSGRQRYYALSFTVEGIAQQALRFDPWALNLPLPQYLINPQPPPQPVLPVHIPPPPPPPPHPTPVPTRNPNALTIPPPPPLLPLNPLPIQPPQTQQPPSSIASQSKAGTANKDKGQFSKSTGSRLEKGQSSNSFSVLDNNITWDPWTDSSEPPQLEPSS